MAPEPFLVTMGDNVVDIYQERNEMYAGGNCVNVSAFATRAGARSAYCGQVGDDAAGRHIEVSLAQQGVDLSFLRMVPGETATCRIGHRGGDRVFLGSSLGVSVFSPTSNELQALRNADAAHVGATSYLDEWITDIAALSRLSYDFTTFREPEHIERVAPHCFLATFSGGGMSSEEADRLTSRALEAGAVWVLVTRGERGATLSDSSQSFHVSAAPTEVVDTLGAGDAFLANVLVGLLRTEDPKKLLAKAAVAAAATCRSFGAFGPPAPVPIDLPAH